MSTLAIWLFIAVGLLLIGALLMVLAAMRSTLRKGGKLIHELDGLSQDMDTVMRPVDDSSRHPGHGDQGV